jgi:serine phosphatase RsbU (regulator of sigma subunit)
MEDIAIRIHRAVAAEDLRAERLANRARLSLLVVLTCIALVNAASVSVEANVMNIGCLAVGFAYGLTVSFRIRRSGYFPMMKYLTSCFDIVLLMLLLFLYTKIEIPAVALKNYVFVVVFPLIALTAFRYDRVLTLVAGGLAVLLYLALILYLCLSGAVTFTNGGYEHELFSREVTYVGQGTKILILSGYVLLVSYLARYSRRLIVKLVRQESNLRSQKESMEWELEIASSVQSLLQPRSFPDVRGLDIYGAVEQGKFVGGDYCDFLKVAEDVLLLVVADVSGKGVPAALIMSEVRATTQLLAPMNMNLEQLTRRLNTLLHTSTRKKDFVTFFVAEINTSRQTIQYVNAGHPPPLLLSQGELRPLSRRTVPLGVFEVLPELTVQTERFSPGSVLVSYTDGILERRDPAGEQYGEERLSAFLRANHHLGVEPFVRGLLEEVRKFGQGSSLDDDVGVAVARYDNS